MNTNEDQTDPVPCIYATEPVYPNVEATRPVWVTCKLEWDSRRKAFVNREARDEWILDESGMVDAWYSVEGSDKMFESLEEAKKEAIQRAEISPEPPIRVYINP